MQESHIIHKTRIFFPTDELRDDERKNQYLSTTNNKRKTHRVVSGHFLGCQKCMFFCCS